MKATLMSAAVSVEQDFMMIPFSFENYEGSNVALMVRPSESWHSP